MEKVSMQQRRGIKNLQPINPGSLTYQKNQDKNFSPGIKQQSGLISNSGLSRVPNSHNTSIMHLADNEVFQMESFSNQNDFL